MKRILLKTLLLIVMSFNIAVAQDFTFNQVLDRSNESLTKKQVQKIKKLENNENYSSFNLVSYDDPNKIPKSEYLMLTLPEFGSVKVIKKHLSLEENGDFVWEGAFKNHYMILLKNGKEIFGKIQGGGNVYRIASIGEKHIAILKHIKKTPASHQCLIHPDNDKPSEEISESEGIHRHSSKLSFSNTVNVLVLVTDRARDIGGDISNTIRTEIAIWNNTVRRNSNLNTSLRLANVLNMRPGLSETPNSTDDADEAAFLYLTRTLAINSTIQRVRNENKADIVVVITGNSFGNNRIGVLGVAASGRPNNGLAYSLVELEDLLGPEFAFQHEVGHLFGADHQVAPNITITTDRANARGHSWSVGGQRFASIMYNAIGSNATNAPFFSNPSVNDRGVPTGRNDRNNASAINTNGHRLAGFRDGFLVSNVNINGPSRVEGGKEAFYTSTVVGGFGSYRYSWEIIGSAGTILFADDTPTVRIRMDEVDDTILRLTVTDRDGNVFTQTKHIFNEDCFICLTDDDLGFNFRRDEPNDAELAEERLLSTTLYPNPSNGILNLHIDQKDNEYSKVSIVDLNGREIYQESITTLSKAGSDLKMDISAYKPGTYFLQLIGNSSTKTIRFIKE